MKTILNKDAGGRPPVAQQGGVIAQQVQVRKPNLPVQPGHTTPVNNQQQ